MLVQLLLSLSRVQLRNSQPEASNESEVVSNDVVENSDSRDEHWW